VENSGAQAKIARVFKSRKTVRVLTPMNHFLSEQERFLPAGISLHFRFHFNSSKRLIICPAPVGTAKEIQYQLKVNAATLYLRRYRLSASGVASVNRAINGRGGALYPVRPSYTGCTDIAVNSLSATYELVQNGVFPSMVIVGMTLRDSQENMHSSPYLFNHFELAEMKLVSDDEVFPNGLPLRFNYSANDNIVGYTRLQEQIDFKNSDPIYELENQSEYYLYPISLRSDGFFSVDCQDSPKRGNLKLVLSFHKALIHPVRVYVVQVFDRIFQLSSQRVPSFVD
jgi:hypothetical protein